MYILLLAGHRFYFFSLPEFWIWVFFFPWEDVFKLAVFRAENDKSVAGFSSPTREHGPIPGGLGLSAAAFFMAKPYKSCSFFFNSLCVCSFHLVSSAGIPSSHLGPAAMVIGRTHPVCVTMAIGLLMSCLMSTALQKNFKVSARKPLI